jgi:tetratricopeptide (TPR) repeat protein
MKTSNNGLKSFMVVFLLVLLGGTAPFYAREKKHKEAKVPAQVQLSKPLTNEDLRFNYLFLEALRQQNAGHDAAAMELLSRCLQINPNASEAYYLQAMYLSRLRQDSLALSNLEKAAALSPANDTYQEKVAQFYIGMGNFDKATEAYEKLAANHRDRSDILNILVQLYQQQKQYDKMLSAINRIEQIEGESEQITLSKMSVYAMMGDDRNAYKTLKGLADSHPNDPNYTIMLGNWLMQSHRQKDAYKIFTKVLDDDPDNTYALSSLCDYYRATGQDSLAKQITHRILLNPGTPSDTRMQFLRQTIQDNEAQGGDSSKIIELIDQMQQVMPRDSNIVEMKVAYYSLKKLPEEEIDSALVELLNLAPDNAGARFQLIQNLWPKEDWKQIASLAEPGMLYNPDEMAFYYFTGLARYYQKDDDGALDAFQRGVAEINTRSNPDIVSDFYAIMGDIYHSKKMRDKAYAAYDSCLQWKSDHIMALNNYAYYISVDGGDMKKAEEMSAKTIKAEPKNATYLDTYAWILYKQGRYTEAKIYIDQALANDTDSVTSADVLEHAGDIYFHAGETEKAREYWQQAIKAGGSEADLRKKIQQSRNKQ